MNTIERMTFLKKLNVLLLILILAISMGATPAHVLAEDNEIMARVNEAEITREQVLTLLERDYGAYALQELILKELVDQKAQEVGITVNEEEFAVFYDMVINQLGGYEGLYMFLMENNISEEQFREELRWNMLVSNLAGSEVEVTDEAVIQWFEENRQQYDQPEVVEVSHILVESEEEAQDLLALLQDGSELAELAPEHSIDQGTAAEGGYLGVIARGMTVPEFEELAFDLAMGEFAMTESDYGWHIVTVHGREEAQEAVFADVAEFVEQDYRSSQALDGQSYLQKLQQEADLEILWTP